MCFSLTEKSEPKFSFRFFFLVVQYFINIRKLFIFLFIFISFCSMVLAASSCSCFSVLIFLIFVLFHHNYHCLHSNHHHQYHHSFLLGNYHHFFVSLLFHLLFNISFVPRFYCSSILTHFFLPLFPTTYTTDKFQSHFTSLSWPPTHQPSLTDGPRRARGRASSFVLIIFCFSPGEQNVNSHAGKTQRSARVASPSGACVFYRAFPEGVRAGARENWERRTNITRAKNWGEELYRGLLERRRTGGLLKGRRTEGFLKGRRTWGMNWSSPEGAKNWELLNGRRTVGLNLGAF